MPKDLQLRKRRIARGAERKRAKESLAHRPKI